MLYEGNNLYKLWVAGPPEIDAHDLLPIEQARVRIEEAVPGLDIPVSTLLSFHTLDITYPGVVIGLSSMSDAGSLKGRCDWQDTPGTRGGDASWQVVVSWSVDSSSAELSVVTSRPVEAMNRLIKGIALLRCNAVLVGEEK